MRFAFDALFSSAEGYLDTATSGLPPTFAAAEMRRTVERWEGGGWNPKEFVQPAEDANRAFASLIGCPEAGVTQGSSVSALVALIATSLPDDSRVLVARGEYSSLPFPFVAHAHRGITVTEVELEELALHAPEYDLVAVSAVQSADGRVADLAGLRAATEGTSTQVVVDVTQAAGWALLSLDWTDAVVGAAYKWLLGWRGQAWMWSPPTVHQKLTPILANWSAGENRWASNYGASMELASDARRLDSSPVWFAQIAAGTVLPWLASLDRAAVNSHCINLANSVRGAAGIPESASAIVAIPEPELGAKLADAGIRVARRQNGVRLSFHLYNTQGDADAVIQAMGR